MNATIKKDIQRAQSRIEVFECMLFQQPGGKYLTETIRRLENLIKWATEAVEQARDFCDKGDEATVPSWLPELEAALDREKLT